MTDSSNQVSGFHDVNPSSQLSVSVLLSPCSFSVKLLTTCGFNSCSLQDDTTFHVAPQCLLFQPQATLCQLADIDTLTCLSTTKMQMEISYMSDISLLVLFFYMLLISRYQHANMLN